jgi:hypothetical protein
MKRAIILILFLTLFLLRSTAQNKTIPVAITSPYPTLINLAVEWLIEGDDNQNGRVTVQFRQKGEKAWRHGMPLFRVPKGKNEGFSWSNKQSGSIFDLIPGTEYEIWLKLVDPDEVLLKEKLYHEPDPNLKSGKIPG